MRTGVPCNENRFFPVKKTYREFPVSLTGFGFAVLSIKKIGFIKLIMSKFQILKAYLWLIYRKLFEFIVYSFIFEF